MKLLNKYKNGNHIVRIYDDGTKVRETINPSDDHFTYEFPENADIKITDWCNGGCSYCHENSTTSGEDADLRKLCGMLDSMTPGTELAIGGGDALSHRQIAMFLAYLKVRGIIANVTVNQRHLAKHLDFIKRCKSDGLIHGIGVSLVDSKDKNLPDILDQIGDDTVIHVIAGVVEPRDYKVLKGRKILILGYKDLRRGHNNLERNHDKIMNNILQLREDLPKLKNMTKCISFDCLGLSQLDPKAAFKMTEDEWNLRYQGDDYDLFDESGNLTVGNMYIDAVNMKVARSSTAAFDKRYSFTGSEDIRDLLMKTTEGYDNGKSNT